MSFLNSTLVNASILEESKIAPINANKIPSAYNPRGPYNLNGEKTLHSMVRVTLTLINKLVPELPNPYPLTIKSSNKSSKKVEKTN